MTIKERILAYIDLKGMPISKFEAKAGLAGGYVKNLKDVTGTDKILKIIQAFPEISLSWLLMGEGDMLVSEANSNKKTTYTAGR